MKTPQDPHARPGQAKQEKERAKTIIPNLLNGRPDSNKLASLSVCD